MIHIYLEGKRSDLLSEFALDILGDRQLSIGHIIHYDRDTLLTVKDIFIQNRDTHVFLSIITPSHYIHIAGGK